MSPTKTSRLMSPTKSMSELASTLLSAITAHMSSINYHVHGRSIPSLSLIMPQWQVACVCNKCNGQFVISSACLHTSDSSIMSQDNRRTTALSTDGPKDGPCSSSTGPISTAFPIPLCEPPPPISPDVHFPDPPRTLSLVVEQQMLNNGFLTGEDLDIMTSDLLHLGTGCSQPRSPSHSCWSFLCIQPGSI